MIRLWVVEHVKARNVRAIIIALNINGKGI
jgi:hypothetical protein